MNIQLRRTTINHQPNNMWNPIPRNQRIGADLFSTRAGERIQKKPTDHCSEQVQPLPSSILDLLYLREDHSKILKDR